MAIIVTLAGRVIERVPVVVPGEVRAVSGLRVVRFRELRNRYAIMGGSDLRYGVEIDVLGPAVEMSSAATQIDLNGFEVKVDNGGDLFLSAGDGKYYNIANVLPLVAAYAAKAGDAGYVMLSGFRHREAVWGDVVLIGDACVRIVGVSRSTIWAIVPGARKGETVIAEIERLSGPEKASYPLVDDSNVKVW